MYVICVTFQIKSERIDDFMPVILPQARTSLSTEEGCHVFDVCRSENDPGTVFLYEVYSDKAALDLHLSSAHFIQFDAAVSDMVQHKVVDAYKRDLGTPSFLDASLFQFGFVISMVKDRRVVCIH